MTKNINEYGIIGKQVRIIYNKDTNTSSILSDNTSISGDVQYKTQYPLFAQAVEKSSNGIYAYYLYTFNGVSYSLTRVDCNSTEMHVYNSHTTVIDNTVLIHIWLDSNDNYSRHADVNLLSLPGARATRVSTGVTDLLPNYSLTYTIDGQELKQLSFDRTTGTYSTKELTTKVIIPHNYILWMSDDVVCCADSWSATTLKIYRIDFENSTLIELCELTGKTTWNEYFNNFGNNISNTYAGSSFTFTNKQGSLSGASYGYIYKYSWEGEQEEKITSIMIGNTTFSDVSDGDITANDVVKGKIGYGLNGKVYGNLEATKQFSTVEEMNASTGNKDGDLAVIYKNEIKLISNGDIITSITFPKTVVFAEAITSSYNGVLRTDIDPVFELRIELNASSCSITDIFSMIDSISYSSTDGITYTRTDSNQDTYEIGETTVEDLDEHICQFIQTDKGVFGGLFQYASKNTAWKLAPTQLTAAANNVYESIFYGKNGVETGTLQNKDNLTANEVVYKAKIWADFNTGIVCPESMAYAFKNSKLTIIPLLDTSKVTDMNNMFYGCTSLSDESLNIILTMCTNATKITSNKTLKYIGLTEEQANKCKTLSNYSAFTAAGWTTGYADVPNDVVME